MKTIILATVAAIALMGSAKADDGVQLPVDGCYYNSFLSELLGINVTYCTQLGHDSQDNQSGLKSGVGKPKAEPEPEPEHCPRAK